MDSDTDLISVSLTPEESAILAEYEQAMRDLQQQAHGAVRLMIRSRGLTGNWKLSGNQLVRAE